MQVMLWDCHPIPFIYELCFEAVSGLTAESDYLCASTESSELEEERETV